MNQKWPLLLFNQYKLDSKYKTDSIKFLIYNQSERTYLLQGSKSQEYKELKKSLENLKKKSHSLPQLSFIFPTFHRDVGNKG